MPISWVKFWNIRQIFWQNYDQLSVNWLVKKPTAGVRHWHNTVLYNNTVYCTFTCVLIYLPSQQSSGSRPRWKPQWADVQRVLYAKNVTWVLAAILKYHPHAWPRVASSHIWTWYSGICVKNNLSSTLNRKSAAIWTPPRHLSLKAAILCCQPHVAPVPLDLMSGKWWWRASTMPYMLAILPPGQKIPSPSNTKIVSYNDFNLNMWMFFYRLSFNFEATAWVEFSWR